MQDLNLVNSKHFPRFRVNDSSVFNPQSLQFVSNQGDHKLWMSSETSKVYEQHLIMTPSINTYEEQMEIYEWRREQRGNVSEVEYVEQLNSDGVVRELRIFIQRTTKLVKRTRKFDWKRGVELLKSCLRGFETLYRKFGLISVSDLMIAFDDNDRPKVWINSNFARNTCIYYGNYQNDRVNEQGKMVRSIYQIIESYIQKNQILTKLRKSVSSTRSFAAAYSNIEMVLIEERTSRNVSQTKSQSTQRKYFSKTPENILKVNYKKQQSTQMKLSYTPCQQNSYKFIPKRPNCLVFKNNGAGGRKDGNKFSSSKDRKYGGITSKNLSVYLLSSKERDVSLTPHKKSMMNFSTTGIKTKRHYFGNNKVPLCKAGEKSKQKTTVKQSWSSNDFSFKSQQKTRTEVHQSTLKPSNLLERFTNKRTGSTFNRSPSPVVQNVSQKFQSSEFFAPIAKSMTVIKKQLELLNNLKTKDYSKQSMSDFQKSQVFEDTRPRRESRFNEFSYIRMINQSIIQNPVQQPSASSTNIFTYTKNSHYPKIDDLKQSQIIAQTIQEHSSKIGLQSPGLPPKQPKALKKLSNKAMTQSITFEKPKSETQIAEPVEYVPTALDRFAKFRTQSKIPQPIKSNFQGEIVAINEALDEQL